MKDPAFDFARFQVRFGWWSLLVFATLGAVLEAMHGFKVASYLDVGNENRRLMWTLAHAHGTLLATINIVAGLSRLRIPTTVQSHAPIAGGLTVATILIPAGFLMMGTFATGRGPQLGFLLVAMGALLLLLAIGTAAASSMSRNQIRS